jgi:hypothetical protein
LGQQRVEAFSTEEPLKNMSMDRSHQVWQKHQRGSRRPNISLRHFSSAAFAACGVLFLAVLLSACGEDGPPDYAPDPPGAWYRIDLHVHATGASNDTGGDSWPSAIAERAQALGLDAVMLADHSNSTGSDPSTTDEDSLLFNMGNEFPYWDSAAILSSSDFLLVQGNELSPVKDGAASLQPTGHIGCLPPDLMAFDTSYVFTDRPMGAVSGGDALGQAKAAGCWSILYHPYAVAPWIRYDWQRFDYDAMEVWNGTGGWDLVDEFSRRAWLCDWVQGRRPVLVGGSDNHRVNIPAPGGGTDPALGHPYTAVFAEGLSWPAIVAGLQAGRTAVGEGNSILQLDAYTPDGDPSDGSDAAWVRVRGTIDAQALDPVLTVSRCTACVDNRPGTPNEGPDVAEEVLEEMALTPGSELDLEYAIEGQSGIYHAIVRTADGHYGSLSRAIAVP